MTEPTYRDVIDWLSDREGEQVYMEVGQPDPTKDSTDIIVVAQHVSLGKTQIGENLDHEGRGIAYVPFEGQDRNRFYIDPEHITAIRGGAHLGIKVVFHDGMYVAFS